MSSIIVSNVPKTAKEDEIKDFFAFGADDGEVQDITPLDNSHETKTYRVSFEKAGLISNALLLNGADFKDSTVRVVEESGGIKSHAIAEAN